MFAEHREFTEAQLETIARDLGIESREELERENEKVLEWVEKNAARFRAQWVRTHGFDGSGRGNACTGAS